MYLLDTNVVSEVRKAIRGRCDAAVAAWVTSVDTQLLHLSVITIMELETGCLQLQRRDPRQAAVLRRWIDHDIRVAFSGERLLPIDVEIACVCARLHVPNYMSHADAWIAATALVHDLTVVTRNIKDFRDTGAKLLNPWQFSPE